MSTIPPDLAFVYVGDPMCSWCWGFSPVLEQLAARFVLPVEVIAGGLRPGDAAVELDDGMRAFLLRHWAEIGERTGQPFDTSFLDRRGWRYDTMTADTAVVTMRRLEPDRTLDFFTRLQRAFYAEAVDITDPGTYPQLLAGFDVEPARFVEMLTSDDVIQETWGDFAASRRMGVVGFPTLFLREARTVYPVTRGYAPFEPIEEALRRFLDQRSPGVAAGRDGS